MIRLLILAAAVLLAVITAAPAAAQEDLALCPTFDGLVCDGWVTDAAGVIGDDTRLEETVGRLVAQYGNQIAVVVVPTTGGTRPSDYAADLGNAWGVGDSDRDDGIVVLVAIAERRTEIVPGGGLSGSGLDPVASSGDTFFGSGDFEAGLIAILGSLESWLAGDAPAAPSSPSRTPGFTIFLVLVGSSALIAVGGATASRRRKRDAAMAQRTVQVDDELDALEVAGHELPLVADYAVAPPPTLDPGAPVATAETLRALRALDAGEAPPPDGLDVMWASGAIAVLEADRLRRDVEVPLELRVTGERAILEESVQTTAREAVVRELSEAEFGVKLKELQRGVAALRPHRVAAARRRIGEGLADRLVTTSIGPTVLTDAGARLLRAGAALDPEAALLDSLDQIEAAYASATAKTAVLTELYEKLPMTTARPAVAAALADVEDDPDAALSRYEELRQHLESEGSALESDGLSIPAIAALLLMNRDETAGDEFIAAYKKHRSAGLEPAEAVEYALAGIQDPAEVKAVRKEAEKLGLPVSITAALLRRRDDGPAVFRELRKELGDSVEKTASRRTIAAVLAISLEPAQAVRRWHEAREALADLGLEGAYADVAAAFGASDPRGARAFALSYAATREALAESDIDDADRFAPELAHEGTKGQTDTWSGERIPPDLRSFDPFTLLFYHWVITRGHSGSYGWEPIHRDASWSGSRGSWWGGGGGFSGKSGGGSSWGSGGFGGGFGGFGGGGGFSGGGGGGSGW